MSSFEYFFYAWYLACKKIAGLERVTRFWTPLFKYCERFSWNLYNWRRCKIGSSPWPSRTHRRTGGGQFSSVQFSSVFFRKRNIIYDYMIISLLGPWTGEGKYIIPPCFLVLVPSIKLTGYPAKILEENSAKLDIRLKILILI